MYHKVDLPVGSFPIFDKVTVNGPGTLEAYAVLKQGAKSGHDAGFDVMWNYEKFLVDGEGKPVYRYSSTASPLEAECQIKQLLKISSDMDQECDHSGDRPQSARKM